MVAKMLAARRGRTGWDWTDWATYLYLVLGVLLMFGPVLWLFLSSVKTQAGLDMFPPTFLPWEQKQLSLPGKPTMPMFQVTAGDHAGQERFERRKREYGLAGRDDIQTRADLIDADEGRLP